jgi:hypothetical protein
MCTNIYIQNDLKLFIKYLFIFLRKYLSWVGVALKRSAHANNVSCTYSHVSFFSPKIPFLLLNKNFKTRFPNFQKHILKFLFKDKNKIFRRGKETCGGVRGRETFISGGSPPN